MRPADAIEEALRSATTRSVPGPLIRRVARLIALGLAHWIDREVDAMTAGDRREVGYRTLSSLLKAP